MGDRLKSVPHAKIAHANWVLFEKGRAALKKARGD